MASVATQPQKSNKAFRATVYDQAGTLVKVDDVIYFLTDDDVVPFEVEMAPWTTILGEVGLSETARLLDTLHGGAAWIATHRPMQEV